MSFRYALLLVMFSAGFSANVASAAAQPEEWSWWEIFFPHLKEKGPDPSETLQAPFADPDAVIDAPSSSGQFNENATPINLPHRINTEIAEWLEAKVSDLLTYQAEGYQDQYKAKVMPLMTKPAMAEYVKFLQENNIVTSLKSGAYDVRGFVQDVPVLVNEGEVGGRFRWLFQVKVMVSFVKSGLKSYRDVGNGQENVTKEYIATVQIGRVEDAGNPDGVLIESWTAKMKP